MCGIAGKLYCDPARRLQVDTLAAMGAPLRTNHTELIVRPVSDAKVGFDFKARRFVGHALLEPGERHHAWKAFFDPAQKRTLLRPELQAGVTDDPNGYAAYRP